MICGLKWQVTVVRGRIPEQVPCQVYSYLDLSNCHSLTKSITEHQTGPSAFLLPLCSVPDLCGHPWPSVSSKTAHWRGHSGGHPSRRGLNLNTKGTTCPDSLYWQDSGSAVVTHRVRRQDADMEAKPSQIFLALKSSHYFTAPWNSIGLSISEMLATERGGFSLTVTDSRRWCYLYFSTHFWDIYVHTERLCQKWGSYLANL